MVKELLHETPALDKRESGRYGRGMIEQVAKLQSDVEYIKRDVAELKVDMREMRKEIREIREIDFRDVRDRQERDFRILFTAIIAVAVGLAGLFAKGFGWL